MVTVRLPSECSGSFSGFSLLVLQFTKLYPTLPSSRYVKVYPIWVKDVRSLYVFRQSGQGCIEIYRTVCLLAMAFLWSRFLDLIVRDQCIRHLYCIGTDLSPVVSSSMKRHRDKHPVFWNHADGCSLVGGSIVMAMSTLIAGIRFI